ncbi:hypothetical protein [Lederbergia galactosidilytica]
MTCASCVQTVEKATKKISWCTRSKCKLGY